MKRPTYTGDAGRGNNMLSFSQHSINCSDSMLHVHIIRTYNILYLSTANLHSMWLQLFIALFNGQLSQLLLAQVLNNP